MKILPAEKELVKKIQKSRGKYQVKGVPQPKKTAAGGVYVGGKKITSFSQVKVKKPEKLTTGERLHRGIGIAIL